MIRRSDRPAQTTTSNGVIYWRVVRYKLFGFVIYESQTELPGPPRPVTRPDDTAEFAPAIGGAKV